MWQIVTVAVLGLRINAAFIPLISRVGVIFAALMMTLLVFSAVSFAPLVFFVRRAANRERPAAPPIAGAHG